MSGCDNFCAYCAVPYTRGREKSRSACEIIAEIKKLVKKEYKEIWLLGQNVNSYNPQNKNIDFPDLLKLINDIPGKFWIRFASPHPKDFSDKLIKTIASCEKIPRYTNLPVQSGDNEILKKMNRGYTREDFLKLFRKIKSAMPEISVSTDTIVGFPGETKKQYKNTCDLYKKCSFDMAFIAKYSPRPGTAAALAMKDNVSHNEKERRRTELTKILASGALKNNKKLIGKTEEILVDEEKNGRIFGRNGGNKTVEIENGKNLRPGDWAKIKITEAGAWSLKGYPAKPKIICVLGPTASGKSDLAVDIALKINGEVISADSRQVYKKMDIGTGKITKKEMRGIKHHLLDMVAPSKIYTVANFKNDAGKAVTEITKKNKTPIICGGTGFYINSLLNDIEIPEVPPDKKLRKQIEQKTVQELHKILTRLDKKFAEKIDKNNKRRLVRAIEIAKALGQIPELKKSESPYDILWIGIKISPQKLKNKIKTRLEKRMRRGMIREVEILKNNGISWKRLDDFGLEYRYVSRYLKNQISKEEMISRLSSEIINYSKRQMTWFKKYAPKTIWIKNSRQAVNLAEKFLRS
jgi:tRNA dimethylallyltransferase